MKEREKSTMSLREREIQRHRERERQRKRERKKYRDQIKCRVVLRKFSPRSQIAFSSPFRIIKQICVVLSMEIEREKERD